MANFGWAYINCDDSGSGGTAKGPTGSIQFLSSSVSTAGTAAFMFYTAAYSDYTADTLVLSGTFMVSGTISASHFHIEDVTRIDATGSTYFGNSSDDTHLRTGSIIGVAASVGGADGKYYISGSAHSDKLYVSNLAISGGLAYAHRQVDDATAGALRTASTSDYYLGVDSTGGTVDIYLLTTPEPGQTWVIKDEGGAANTNNIIITCSTDVSSDSVLIEGQKRLILTSDYASITIYAAGANQYFIC